MMKIMLRAIIAALILLPTMFAHGADPIRIGYSICKTGLFAQGAPSQITAYELWRDQVNAAGGLDVAGHKRPIEFIWYDDESSPAKAAQIYEKLITDDQVDLLLPPWGTPHHLSVAGVAEKYRFPIVGNTAASVAIRELKPGYIWFVTAQIPDRIGIELAALMSESGVKSAAVIANVLPFAQENFQFLIPALEQAGITVKLTEQYPPDISDMTTMLTSIKNADVDAVIALSYPSDSFLYMGQAKELGIDSPFQFLLVGPAIEAFMGAFGSSADRIVTMGHWSPHQKAWPRAMQFFKAYQEKYQGVPDYLDTAMAYMSLEILEQAVAIAGLDKEKLRDTIASGTFDTINGLVRFEGVENVITPTGFLQIQGSDMHLIWPKEVATSSFQSR